MSWSCVVQMQEKRKIVNRDQFTGFRLRLLELVVFECIPTLFHGSDPKYVKSECIPEMSVARK